MGLANMDAAAKAFIVKHAEKVVGAGGFADLPKEILVALLSNEKPSAKEGPLLEAVAAWEEVNEGSGAIARSRSRSREASWCINK